MHTIGRGVRVEMISSEEDRKQTRDRDGTIEVARKRFESAVQRGTERQSRPAFHFPRHEIEDFLSAPAEHKSICLDHSAENTLGMFPVSNPRCAEKMLVKQSRVKLHAQD